ncbi:anti-CBASS protein Acb1 family protein [Paracoccus fontiphilus]|uniref:Anti-CBASS protein Acb1 family protein n=1 Tax=Paracoccus fontiphilus TaxID=1815556 RepID=A0ABV7ILC7_9RHOB|nr:anti-CBASS Acb1 family protein [Paracoccus fontiphilus]
MNPIAMIVNAARRLDALLPGYFPETKHQHAKDFGWPDDVRFEDALRMYRRHSIARAGVNKTVLKTWQDFPALWETEKAGNTKAETEIAKHFRRIGLWRALAEADRRAIVGGYAGVILRFADGKAFDQPVGVVPGGLEGLVEAVPVWCNQLAVADWIDDASSDAYGQPKSFTFNEAAIGGTAGRSFTVHPDRVLIWSADGTVAPRSDLEPGYNDLLDMEKVKGAGGEGFWKNAKSSPVLEVDKEAKIAEMARAMGVPEDEVADAMNDQVEEWQKGFDKLLMLQGMQAKTLNVTLPSPEHFHSIPLLSFAASLGIPAKILIGSQTGERASTEDADEWDRTCNARRENIAKPRIKALADRLVRFRVLPDRDWFVGWSDLTEASPGEKIDRAVKMASINQTQRDEPAFTATEIREQAGFEGKAPAPYYDEADLQGPPDDPDKKDE